jgi:hypothetical protein
VFAAHDLFGDPTSGDADHDRANNRDFIHAFAPLLMNKRWRRGRVPLAADEKLAQQVRKDLSVIAGGPIDQPSCGAGCRIERKIAYAFEHEIPSRGEELTSSWKRAPVPRCNCSLLETCEMGATLVTLKRGHS